MITIKKQTLYYWLAIFVLQVLFVAWYQGLLVPDTVKPDTDSVVPPVVPGELVMTATQAGLTQQAIGMIRDDVEHGQIRTADLAIQALSALLPSSVRQRVLQELGNPDIEYMRDALDILDGKIIIQE
ncbi:MAG: hypothetical protein FWG73_06500 [Planctomycetaceae bacterium]|nr:hypothetical protein [Planctomycetaceae bacterium]